jgi:hypothetical protein
VSAVSDVIDRYLRDNDRPGDMELDAAYQLQMHVIRSMLSLLEDALKGEGVPETTSERVVRRLLTGSPWPDEEEARDRMREHEEAVQVLMLAPPAPVVLADLGLPPK